MASLEFEVPELLKNIHTPPINPGVMQSSGPFIAKPDHQEPLGFPGELGDNWEQRAIEAMGEAVESTM